MLYIKKVSLLVLSIFVLCSYNLSFADDTYDPFSDYSEFTIIKEEERDVNFFNDGRFLSLGVLVQRAEPVGDLAEAYGGAFGVHVFAQYFFDLRFALQLSLGYQDHQYVTTGESPIRSSANFRDLGLGVKYYFNPDRIVYSLSRFNPYMLVGISLITETRSLGDVSDATEDLHTAYNFGVGFELPLPGKKFFISVQALYNFASSFGQLDLLGNKTGGFLNTAVSFGLNF